MAVLFLGYVNDPVALETFGAIIGDRLDSADCKSVFEEEPAEFSNFGTVRTGRLTALHSGRKTKRVVLAFLNPRVTAARVIGTLGFAPARAVLVATAHSDQIKRMKRAGIGLRKGFGAFCGERAPVTDTANAFLIIGKRIDRRRSEELAAAIVRNFVFPEAVARDEIDSNKLVVPVVHTVPQYG